MTEAVWEARLLNETTGSLVVARFVAWNITDALDKAEQRDSDSTVVGLIRL